MKIMLLTLTAFSHLLNPDLQFLSLLTLELLTSLKGNPGGKAGAGHREPKVERLLLLNLQNGGRWVE